jgi:hypothetical protein
MHSINSLLSETKTNRQNTSSNSTVTNTITSLIILNKHRCLNVILGCARSFVRSLVSVCVRLCRHDKRGARLILRCLSISTLVRWESGINGCSHTHTHMHITQAQYNHPPILIFPFYRCRSVSFSLSLSHDCVSHVCSLDCSRIAYHWSLQTTIEPQCVSFHGGYICQCTIVTYSLAFLCRTLPFCTSIARCK